MSRQIIKLPEVIKTTGLSSSTVYRLISENRFPSQISLGARSSGWVFDEVQQWITDRISASRNDEAA